MAVNIPTSKPKTILYKMVTVPKVKVTPQNSATVTSYKAFTSGLNRLGATINSMIVLQQRTNAALTESLKLKVKEAEDARKQAERSKFDKKGGGLGKLATNVGVMAAFVVKDFFESIAGLFGGILKAVLVQGILQWLANPANREKLTVIWNAMVGFFKFLWNFISTSVGMTLSGLSDMLNSNKSFWERLKGFGTFLVGLGGLLLTFAFLKKPALLLGGVKFVLKTIWDSVSGLISLLGKRKGKLSQTPGAAPRAPGGKPGSAPPGPAAAPRGRAGAIMKGIGAVSMIAAPLVVGGILGQGENEFTKARDGSAPTEGVPGPTPAPAVDKTTPQAKDGGIFTRPTQAIIGEAGPEMRVPLISGAQNAMNYKDNGILPLPGGGGGAQPDRKQAENLSKLYQAPFKGVGAAILANMGAIAPNVPGPVLNTLVAPIANSFGVPAAIVNKLAGKKDSDAKKKKGVGFGQGRRSSQGKKFQRKGDNSVLGLLTDIVGAGQVINNKLGVGEDNTASASSGSAPAPTSKPPDTTPGEGAKEDSADKGSASAVEAANKGKGSQDLSKGESKGASVATQQGQSSDQRRKMDSSNAAANRHELPFMGPDGKTQYKALLNATNGDYEVYQDVGALGIPVWRRLQTDQDKNTLQKQKAFNQVRAFFIKSAPKKGLALNYITEDDVKRREELVKRYDAEAKSKAVDTSTPPRNRRNNVGTNPPQKANGGWIQGPQSGYPVSLDGGGSTSFIGHGTEWVGFKKAMGGKSGTDAFVVPFDTPATKNNPGLTGSRMRQAKSGGYAMPKFSAGGKAEQEKLEKSENFASGDGRPKKKASAGGAILEGAKKTIGYGKGVGDQCANSTRAALRAAGSTFAGKVTKKGDLDAEGTKYNGPGFAASFAGSDMGTVIKSPGALEPGDIVLWKGGGGYGPGAITHVGIKGEGSSLYHHGRKDGFRKTGMYTSYGAQSFKAGIRLGGAVGAVGSDPSNPNAPADPANPSDPNAAGGGSADVLAEMERSMSELKVMMGVNPAPAAAEAPPTEVWVNKKTGAISLTDPSKTKGLNPKEFEKKSVSKLTEKEKATFDKLMKDKKAQTAAPAPAPAPGAGYGSMTAENVAASAAAFKSGANASVLSQQTTATAAAKDGVKAAAAQATTVAAAGAAAQLSNKAAETGRNVMTAPPAPPIVLPSDPPGKDICLFWPGTGLMSFNVGFR